MCSCALGSFIQYYSYYENIADCRVLVKKTCLKRKWKDMIRQDLKNIGINCMMIEKAGEHLVEE